MSGECALIVFSPSRLCLISPILHQYFSLFHLIYVVASKTIFRSGKWVDRGECPYKEIDAAAVEQTFPRMMSKADKRHFTEPLISLTVMCTRSRRVVFTDNARNEFESTAASPASIGWWKC